MGRLTKKAEKSEDLTVEDKFSSFEVRRAVIV